tara:strand:+ start:3858 stop:4202 length:345 start_codon:yes stop_codon:yes gene_type:complete
LGGSNRAIIGYTVGMAHLKIVNLEERRPNPSHTEGKERLDKLFEDFVKRGAQPEMIAEMILAYGICEVLNYSRKPENGLDSISRLLSESFNLNIDRNEYFDPELGGFVKKDDDE